MASARTLSWDGVPARIRTCENSCQARKKQQAAANDTNQLAAGKRDEKQCSEKQDNVGGDPWTRRTPKIATVSLDDALQRGNTRRCCNLQFGTSPLASDVRDFVLTDRQSSTCDRQGDRFADKSKVIYRNFCADITSPTSRTPCESCGLTCMLISWNNFLMMAMRSSASRSVPVPESMWAESARSP